MKKKTLKVCIIAALAMIASTTATVVATNTKGLAEVFAGIRLNEYGCEQNCTAEYYPSDLITRVKADNTLVGTQNVRVIARACNFTTDSGRTFFQDITTAVYKGNKLTPVYLENNRVIQISGTSKGLNHYQADDIVAFYGEVRMEEMRMGYDVNGDLIKRTVVRVYNPTFYQVNDTKDLSLLVGVDPVYLGQ